MAKAKAPKSVGVALAQRWDTMCMVESTKPFIAVLQRLVWGGGRENYTSRLGVHCFHHMRIHQRVSPDPPKQAG